MKIYTDEQLKLILKKHQLWLDDREGGERADLRHADLSQASLRGVNLHGATLGRADGLDDGEQE